MIWVLFPRMGRPHRAARLAINVAVGVALVSTAYIISLLTDDAPPITDARGTPAAPFVYPGGHQNVAWNLVERRYCGETHSYRALSSEADPDWVYPLPDIYRALDPDVPRPRIRRGSSVEIPIPPEFPMLPGNAPTKAWYRVRVVAACNWLQEWLPERMRVQADLPAVEFEVRARQTPAAESPGSLPR